MTTKSNLDRHDLTHEPPVLCRCGKWIAKEGLTNHLASFQHGRDLAAKERGDTIEYLKKKKEKLKVEDGRADKRNQRAIKGLARTRDEPGIIWLVEDDAGERNSGSVWRGTNRNGHWVRPSTPYALMRRNPRPDL